MEDIERDLTKVEADLRIANHKVLDLTPRVEELEEELRRTQEDKTRFKMEADKARNELTDKRRQVDMLEEVCMQERQRTSCMSFLSDSHPCQAIT